MDVLGPAPSFLKGMKMTLNRLRFRIMEMFLSTGAVILVDGLMHIWEGEPFMSDYLWGGAFAAFLIRGLDAHRAWTKQWPENTP
jgi:hypothetical protein